MKKKKFHQGIIMRMLAEQRRGKSVTQICYKYGISPSTFYRWAKKAGLLHRLRQLQNEIAQYESFIAAQASFISSIKFGPNKQQ